MNPETEERVSDLLLWRDPDAHELLKSTCQAHQIQLEAMAELLAWMRQVKRKGDKYGGLNQQLDQIFEEPNLWKQQNVD